METAHVSIPGLEYERQHVPSTSMLRTLFRRTRDTSRISVILPRVSEILLIAPIQMKTQGVERNRIVNGRQSDRTSQYFDDRAQMRRIQA